jgi:hypothetical protein
LIVPSGDAVTVGSAMPADWFDVLFEDDISDGIGLPLAFRNVYGGDWRIAIQSGLPHLYVSVVVSRDGRVSFREPGNRSLVEGAAFAPGAAPSSTLISLRRGGDYLYLRSRYPGA